MENFAGLSIFISAISVLEILSVVFSLLFMHYSAKQRNHSLSVGWYICGAIFGLWALIVFLIKRKDFPGEGFKVCPSCGAKYPVNYEICSQCLVELPVINAEEKKKEKKLAKIFGTAVIITYVAAMVSGIALGATMFSEIVDTLSDTADRIAVDGVFYDKKGNTYKKDEDVLLYGKDGSTYTYTAETITDEVYDFEYEEYYYVRDDGEKYRIYDCYVTEDGWFYCDKGDLLEYYYPDTENMSEEELDEYYREQLELENADYKYYNYSLTDKKGNVYYTAYEASWNEKGELITAENDVSVKE